MPNLNVSVSEGLRFRELIWGGHSGIPLLIETGDVKDFAISRGTQYYNAAGFTLTTVNETEIGTITIVTHESDDSIWLWASVDITQFYKVYGGGKGGDICPIQFRIRRDSTGGTIVAASLADGYDIIGFPPSIILIGTDIPGGSAGNHIYKFTAQQSYGTPYQNGIVAYRKLFGFAKSR